MASLQSSITELCGEEPAPQVKDLPLDFICMCIAANVIKGCGYQLGEGMAPMKVAGDWRAWHTHLILTSEVVGWAVEWFGSKGFGSREGGYQEQTTYVALRSVTSNIQCWQHIAYAGERTLSTPPLGAR